MTPEMRARWEQETAYIAEDLKRNFITPEQRDWLMKHDLGIGEVLTGHLPAVLMDEAVTVLFEPWNERLGEHWFGWGPR